MHDVLNKLTNRLVSVVVLFVRALQFAVWIIRRITQSVSALPCQDHSKRRTPVVALDHRLHLKKKILEKNLAQKGIRYLTGLHHAPEAGLDLLEAV